MNEGKKESFNSAIILSIKRSTKSSNGSLVVNGGIGVGRNMYCNEEICANELISRKNTRIGGNAYVMGTIESEEMFQIIDNEIVYRKSIIPETNKYISLGNEKNKWMSLNSLSIDSEMSLFAGTNTINKIPILNIDNDISNTVLINGNLIMTDDKTNSFMEFNQNKKYVNFNNTIGINNKMLYLNTKTINITDDVNIDISESNRILLNVLSMNNVKINIINKKGFESDNISAITKIVYFSGNGKTIKLKINDKKHKLVNIGDYVDILSNLNTDLFLKKQN